MTRLGTCGDCYRPMAFANRDRTPDGYVTHGGHGQCTTCYTRARRPSIPGTTIGGRPLTDYIDEMAVERALSGMDVTLNAAERQVVVAELTRRGLSSAEVARRTGLAQRSVVRIRAQLRKAA